MECQNHLHFMSIFTVFLKLPIHLDSLIVYMFNVHICAGTLLHFMGSKMILWVYVKHFLLFPISANVEVSADCPGVSTAPAAVSMDASMASWLDENFYMVVLPVVLLVGVSSMIMLLVGIIIIVKSWRMSKMFHKEEQETLGECTERTDLCIPFQFSTYYLLYSNIFCTQNSPFCLCAASCQWNSQDHDNEPCTCQITCMHVHVILLWYLGVYDFLDHLLAVYFQALVKLP